MKTTKYLLWLIIILLLGILLSQNFEYFMTTKALKLNLKVASWNWTTPEIQNIAYFGFCFLLGLILAGIKGFAVKLRLQKTIKTKNAAYESLKQENKKIKTELDVFQHDPYIKKNLEESAMVEQPENGSKEGKKSDAAD